MPRRKVSHKNTEDLANKKGALTKTTQSSRVVFVLLLALNLLKCRAAEI